MTDKTYEGVGLGSAWLVRGPISYSEAERIIQERMRGGNRETSYSLEEEGDHLVAVFLDRDQPQSRDYPGNDNFPKDDTWGSAPGQEHSDKGY